MEKRMSHTDEGSIDQSSSVSNDGCHTMDGMMEKLLKKEVHYDAMSVDHTIYGSHMIMIVQ